MDIAASDASAAWCFAARTLVNQQRCHMAQQDCQAAADGRAGDVRHDVERIRRAARREGLQHLDRGSEDGEAENHMHDAAIRTRGAEQAEHGIGNHVLHFVTDRRRRQYGARQERKNGDRQAHCAEGDPRQATDRPACGTPRCFWKRRKQQQAGCNPKRLWTAKSTRDVKGKRRASLTSVTTVRRCNKAAKRSTVVDVTRLTLRSHRPR